jgi:hypothetical protein
MTNERKRQLEQVDVAILGGGPAGLQSALVLSRTTKKIIVFDDPEPPRNAASHGVHGFLGLDGYLPTDFRKIAWKQIDKYHSAELRKEKIVNVNKEEDGLFFITSDNETSSIKAKKVVLRLDIMTYTQTFPVLSNVGQIQLFPVLFVMVTKIETVFGVLWRIPKWNLSGFPRWHKIGLPKLRSLYLQS